MIFCLKMEGLKRIVKNLVTNPIGRQFQYLVRYNENIQNLEVLLSGLKRRRERMEILVGEAENNLQIINGDVLDWLGWAEEIERV